MGVDLQKHEKIYLIYPYKYTRIVLVCGEKWRIVSRSGGFMFYAGEYNHTIDAKGRVIVPSKLREKLGDTFWVTKGLDGCLYMYDSAEWESFEKKLSELPISSRNLVRFFLRGADSPETDKQGRILLPQSLRTHADLKKDVVFIGVGNKVEIWDKERLDNLDIGDLDENISKLEEMGIRI